MSNCVTAWEVGCVFEDEFLS